MEGIPRRFLQYRQNGDPRKVLTQERDVLPSSLFSTEVLVRWLASPINPLDINKIQGAYAIKMPLPAVGGSEAMGKVVKVGSSVRDLSVGDSVVIYAMVCPTWAEHSIVDELELIKIDSRLSPAAGATLLVNPPTAWIMLKKFGDLKQGDWVIQNSANSGVGRAVIQLARAYGFRTINIVRDRPDLAEMKKELEDLGADVVLSESEMAKTKGGRGLPGHPRLALNGVGGRSCLQIAAALQHGGTIVTYGGMSKQPHELSTSSLVFNDVRAFGVAVGMWMREEVEGRAAEVHSMLKELQALLIAGKLSPPPMDEWPLERFDEAIARSLDGKHRKQCFVMRPTTAAHL